MSCLLARAERIQHAMTELSNTPAHDRRPIGPHSRRIALGKLDGRRRESKLMRELTAELTAHVGGKPSAVQRRLIERATVLHLRLVLMDAAAEPGGGMSERNAREYVCWHNAYIRTLRELGMKGAPERGPSLADHLAAKAAATAASVPPTPVRASPHQRTAAPPLTAVAPPGAAR